MTGLPSAVYRNVAQVTTSDGTLHRMPNARRLEVRTARRHAMVRRDWQHQTSRRIAPRAYRGRRGLADEAPDPFGQGGP